MNHTAIKQLIKIIVHSKTFSCLYNVCMVIKISLCVFNFSLKNVTDDAEDTMGPSPQYHGGPCCWLYVLCPLHKTLPAPSKKGKIMLNNLNVKKTFMSNFLVHWSKVFPSLSSLALSHLSMFLVAAITQEFLRIYVKCVMNDLNQYTFLELNSNQIVRILTVIL